MSRIDGGNRPSSPKGSKVERSERPDASRDVKGTPQGTGVAPPKKETATSRTVQTFQGRSEFESGGRAALLGLPTPPPASNPLPGHDLAAIAGADAELELLSEFPDQADAQGGLASAMLHAHADEPVSQVRIVERLKQDGRLESLFGEVFREGNPYVEEPHRDAVVDALDTAMALGTVTGEDLRAFTRGAYAQEWRQIGSELATPDDAKPVKG